ncbi:hypothetical protein KRX57_04780 [Weeksellaceae bacterium TAE3-ERU29]|nr:hypothetical protein [Weeksellaceae bacterium TAE3-ERU29]
MNKQQQKQKFIEELLKKSHRSNPSNVERILRLASKEAFRVSNIQTKEQRISSEIPRDEEMESKNSTNKKENKKKIHNPKKVVGFLKFFTLDNSNIKLSTHLWDQRLYTTYEDFITKLEKDLKEHKLYDLQNYSYNLYWNKLFPFLKQDKLTDIQKEGDYGWGKHKIKIGWQFPDIIREWCKTHFNDKGELAKQPFSMEIPQELKPEKPIAGKTIKYFEDVVNLFKKEIEFRDNDLYKEFRIITKRDLKAESFDISGLESLRGCSFYTNTEYVSKAISRVFKMIDSRPESPRISIFCDYLEESNEYHIKITHVNSFCNKDLRHPKLLLQNNEDSGDIGAIKNDLMSLCDFSIISKFKKDNKIVFAEIEYLYKGVDNKNYKPKVNIIESEPEGFTFNFKFPV